MIEITKPLRGPNGERYYSAFNRVSKQYHFGICELNKNAARRALRNEIGSDVYKSRWEIRQIGFNHPYVQHAYRVKKLTQKNLASATNTN